MNAPKKRHSDERNTHIASFVLRRARRGPVTVVVVLALGRRRQRGLGHD